MKSMINGDCGGRSSELALNLSNGTSYVTIIPPTVGMYIISLPTSVGTAGQVLTTDGIKLTSWTTPLSSPTTSGTSGQVLVTNGSGGTSWQDALLSPSGGTIGAVLVSPSIYSGFVVNSGDSVIHASLTIDGSLTVGGLINNATSYAYYTMTGNYGIPNAGSGTTVGNWTNNGYSGPTLTIAGTAEGIFTNNLGYTVTAIFTWTTCFDGGTYAVRYMIQNLGGNTISAKDGVAGDIMTLTATIQLLNGQGVRLIAYQASGFGQNIATINTTVASNTVYSKVTYVFV